MRNGGAKPGSQARVRQPRHDARAFPVLEPWPTEVVSPRGGAIRISPASAASISRADEGYPGDGRMGQEGWTLWSVWYRAGWTTGHLRSSGQGRYDAPALPAVDAWSTQVLSLRSGASRPNRPYHRFENLDREEGLSRLRPNGVSRMAHTAQSELGWMDHPGHLRSLGSGVSRPTVKDRGPRVGQGGEYGTATVYPVRVLPFDQQVASRVCPGRYGARTGRRWW